VNKNMLWQEKVEAFAFGNIEPFSWCTKKQRPELSKHWQQIESKEKIDFKSTLSSPPSNL
jgi:hypothetical protein